MRVLFRLIRNLTDYLWWRTIYYKIVPHKHKYKLGYYSATVCTLCKRHRKERNNAVN